MGSSRTEEPTQESTVRGRLAPFFDGLSLFDRDPVQLVNQIIDFGVGGGDFPFDKLGSSWGDTCCLHFTQNIRNEDSVAFIKDRLL